MCLFTVTINELHRTNQDRVLDSWEAGGEHVQLPGDAGGSPQASLPLSGAGTLVRFCDGCYWGFGVSPGG